MIFDDSLKLAGSVDICFVKDEKLRIYDWERSKNLKHAVWDMGLYPLTHVPNTKFCKYFLQLNLYKAILEKKYGKEVNEMQIVVLHPDKKTYEKIEVPDMKKEVDIICEVRRKEIDKYWKLDR